MNTELNKNKLDLKKLSYGYFLGEKNGFCQGVLISVQLFFNHKFTNYQKQNLIHRLYGQA